MLSQLFNLPLHLLTLTLFPPSTLSLHIPRPSLLALPLTNTTVNNTLSHPIPFQDPQDSRYDCYTTPTDYGHITLSLCSTLLTALHHQPHFDDPSTYGPVVQSWKWETRDCGIYLDAMEHHRVGLISNHDVVFAVLEILDRCRRWGLGGEKFNMVPGFVLSILKAV